MNTDLQQMAELLRILAFPRRGTNEEKETIFSIADKVQARWTAEQLQELIDKEP